jgi:hypothetical protein
VTAPLQPGRQKRVTLRVDDPPGAADPAGAHDQGRRMLDYEDSELLLAPLTPIDRASLETLVDAFIRDELPSDGPGCIAYAAASFETRAQRLPESQRMVVLRFAAALRERIARLRCH